VADVVYGVGGMNAAVFDPGIIIRKAAKAPFTVHINDAKNMLKKWSMQLRVKPSLVLLFFGILKYDQIYLNLNPVCKNAFVCFNSMERVGLISLPRPAALETPRYPSMARKVEF